MLSFVTGAPATHNHRRAAWSGHGLTVLAVCCLLPGMGLGCRSAANAPSPSSPSSPSSTQAATPATAAANEPNYPTVDTPTTAAGKRAASLLDALASAEAQAVRDWAAEAISEDFLERVPLEGHVQALSQFQAQYPDAQMKVVKSAREHHLEAYVRSATHGKWASLFLIVDAEAPHKVAELGFGPSGPPPPTLKGPLTQAELVVRVRAYLEVQCAAGFFSGAVLLAKEDELLLTHACGEASKRFHVDNNVDTKFNLGSMNKMFTATAVAQLVEKKLVSYDDPISKFVDSSWLPKKVADQITVHHLLSHRSGLGSYFNETFFNASRLNFRTLDDFKPLVQGEVPQFKPGSEFRYSNTGMLLAGVVVQKASGQDYFAYVDEHIYAPAGMTNSGSFEIDTPVENLAIGYVPDPKAAQGWRNNTLVHVLKGGPAGGGYSSVGDLHKFARALVGETLVGADSLTKIWTNHSPQDEGHGYGYGFSIGSTTAGKVVGHNGGFFGLSAQLDIFLDSGFVVACAANQDGAGPPIAETIGSWVAMVEPEK